jgi:L-ascorbate metabolism protein UlaG (beta-lactamase superfamily)
MHGLPVLVLLLAVGAAIRVTAAPTIAPLPCFVVPEGSDYVAVLHLDDWVSDPEAEDRDLVWTLSGGGALKAELTVDRHLVVRTPDPDWFGSEELLLQVCDPAGACATQTVSLTVENLPDAPVIEPIPTQVTGGGDPFRPLRLSDYGRDPDRDPRGLTWEVVESGPLVVRVDGGKAEVDCPDPEWIGTATVRFRATDADGMTTERDVVYVATERRPVLITYVGVEGFLIEWGSTKILIDGLLSSGFPFGESLRARMRSAGQPFDDLTVALTTHAHYDHFDPQYVVDHLLSDPQTRFVSIAEVTDELAVQPGYAAVADRVTTLAFHDGDETTFTMGDATITAIHAYHVGQGEIPCLAYLIDLGGMRILHVGDVAMASMETGLLSHGLAERDIDVALVNFGRLIPPEGPALIRDGVHARYVIPMHFRTTDIRSAMRLIDGTLDNLVWISEPMQTWIVPEK